MSIQIGKAPEIPAGEFKERQLKFAQRLREAGLAGCLVWSRGAGATDGWAGDVMYLANHYAQIPHVHAPDIFTGGGYAAALVTADGTTTVITTTMDYEEGAIQADDVRVTLHLPQTVADTISSFGLDKERIGLVGAETLLASQRAILDERLPNIEFSPVDTILERLRAVKSAAELDMMRHVVRCGVAWMDSTLEAAVAGATEADYVAAGIADFIRLGGVQWTIPTASGPRAHRYWSSTRMPPWNYTDPIQAGDLLQVDLVGSVNGYFTDFGRTTVVGGDPSAAQRRAIEGVVDLVDAMTAAVAPGRTTGDVYQVGIEWFKENGYGSDFMESAPMFGHSLGLGFEAPWIVANGDWVIEPNMVLAVEASLGEPGVGAPYFEHNVIVTESGLEILDAGAPSKPWEN